VDYKWLRKLEQRGHQEFIPPGLEDPISVRKLLDGVESPDARREGQAGTAAARCRARRALAILEEQAAGYTVLTIPTHLKIELEEKRREAANLEAR